MKPSTVGGQGPMIEALYRILNQFPHLPAADLTAGTVIPQQGPIAPGISITLHSSLADFESWREALVIAPATVEHRENISRHGSHQILEGEGTFAGVPVTLKAFAPLAPDPDPVAPVAAAV
ncbi:hypothetical protein ACWCZ5_16350 [Streptomyces sp. NPDC001667]